MNHTHLPRFFVTLLFILVAGTFFVGTQRAFVPASAAFDADGLPQQADLPTTTSTTDFPALGPTPTPLPASLLPSPTDEAIFMPTPAPTATSTDQTGGDEGNIYVTDTTGIISLAILMVVVVLVGTLLGERKPRQKKESRK
jgi:hypothetical protein